mmetsp:Transcript_8289/g.24890  ORF Transcript_8289/g.24890 Transcript_8289/m.24890 type:complete len:324 (+) Transcript_8289:818-1789(+)
MAASSEACCLFEKFIVFGGPPSSAWFFECSDFCASVAGFGLSKLTSAPDFFWAAARILFTIARHSSADLVCTNSATLSHRSRVPPGYLASAFERLDFSSVDHFTFAVPELLREMLFSVACALRDLSLASAAERLASSTFCPASSGLPDSSWSATASSWSSSKLAHRYCTAAATSSESDAAASVAARTLCLALCTSFLAFSRSFFSRIAFSFSASSCASLSLAARSSSSLAACSASSLFFRFSSFAISLALFSSSRRLRIRGSSLYAISVSFLSLLISSFLAAFAFLAFCLSIQRLSSLYSAWSGSYSWSSVNSLQDLNANQKS